MRHTGQVRPMHAMIESIERNGVPQADTILACPAASFTDPEQSARVRVGLFRNHPQLIGLSDDHDGAIRATIGMARLTEYHPNTI